MKQFFLFTILLASTTHDTYAATTIKAWCQWIGSGDSITCLHPTATTDIAVKPGKTVTCKCGTNGYITYTCKSYAAPDTDEQYDYFEETTSCAPLNCPKNFFDDELGNCVSCVSATGNSKAVTSSSGKIGITSCYLPSGYSASDTSGTYTYTSACYYKK